MLQNNYLTFFVQPYHHEERKTIKGINKNSKEKRNFINFHD